MRDFPVNGDGCVSCAVGDSLNAHSKGLGTRFRFQPTLKGYDASGAPRNFGRAVRSQLSYWIKSLWVLPQ